MRPRRVDTNKRLASIEIVCLVITAGFLGFITSEPEVVSAANVWYVGTGPWNDSATINGGIGLASDGDTVYVYSGTYYENVVVDRTINLTGEDRDTTIINASGIEDAVHINADWVNITGFTAINSDILGWGHGGIELDKVQNCRVFGNNASDNKYGIFLNLSYNNTLANNIVSQGGFYFWTSSNNTIANNTIFKNWVGIGFWWSDYNTVINNNISDNTIGIEISHSSNNIIVNNTLMRSGGINIDYCSYGYNTIIGNTIIGSPTPFKGNGIYVRYSSCNTIIDNTISGMKYGMYITKSSYNTFVGNNILSNQYGIYVSESSYNAIIGNSISSNIYHGVQIDSDGHNTIYHNVFTDNNGSGVQAVDYVGTNRWNDSYPSGGNYWNDWTTPDLKRGPNQDQFGSDGIVDFRYSLDGGAGAKDYYPLTTPPPPVELSDLEVKSSDIIFNPSSPVRNGTLVSISATIHNVGLGEARDVIVRFYNGNPSEPGSYQIGSDIYIPSIGSGSSMNAEVQWTAGPTGIHDIYVVVDPDNTIIEINECNCNNVASKALEVIEIGILPPILYIKAVGEDIILNWTPPDTTGISHYLLYRATTQTGFDFTAVWKDTLNDNESGEPGPLRLRTTWNDTGAASDGASQEYYYTIRTVTNLDEISFTSRTVGKWTKTFSQGVSTFSIPLEPLQTRTTDYYLTDMNATYIKWMNQTTHTWVYHEKDSPENITFLEGGKGYEIGFEDQTRYTFCGMPGAMIQYDEVPFGFSPGVDELTVVIDQGSGNVQLSWPHISDCDQYFVYNSSKQDGFWGDPYKDYFLLDIKSVGNENCTHFGAAADGTKLYYMVVPDLSTTAEKGSSSYSIGVWTGEYDAGYDTFGLPLKLNATNNIDWYCDAINNTWGMNYFNAPEQRWMWHKTIMPEGIYDTEVVMCEGYQVSTTSDTKFTFIGV